MSIETSEIILNGGLTFLAISTAVVLGFVGYYLVKLLKDVSVLAKNVNKTSLILNTELKPTLQELNDTMRSINSIIQSTDEGKALLDAMMQNLGNKMAGGMGKGVEIPKAMMAVVARQPLSKLLTQAGIELSSNEAKQIAQALSKIKKA